MKNVEGHRKSCARLNIFVPKKVAIIIVNNLTVFNPISINNPNKTYFQLFFDMPYAKAKAKNSEYIAAPVHSFAIIIEIEFTTSVFSAKVTVPFPIIKRKPFINRTKRFIKKLFTKFILNIQLSKRKINKNLITKKIYFLADLLFAIFF